MLKFIYNSDLEKLQLGDKKEYLSDLIKRVFYDKEDFRIMESHYNIIIDEIYPEFKEEGHTIIHLTFDDNGELIHIFTNKHWMTKFSAIQLSNKTIDAKLESIQKFIENTPNMDMKYGCPILNKDLGPSLEKQCNIDRFPSCLECTSRSQRTLSTKLEDENVYLELNIDDYVVEASRLDKRNEVFTQYGFQDDIVNRVIIDNTQPAGLNGNTEDLEGLEGNITENCAKTYTEAEENIYNDEVRLDLFSDIDEATFKNL